MKPLPRCTPALLSLALLSACGGGPGNDAGQAIGQAVVCTLRNCTESTALRTDEISMRFTAAQGNGESAVRVSGFVGKSANLTTTVLLQPGETVSASVDGGSETMLANPDGQRLDYETSLPAGSSTPQVQLVFTRDGARHVSKVVMPPAFTVAEPAGKPLLMRSAGSLTVKLAPAPTAAVNASMDGRCSRKDGSSFDVKRSSVSLTSLPTAGSFRVDTLPLDQALNSASIGANNNLPTTSLVSRCELTLTWSATTPGTAPTTLNKYSSFSASREAAHQITYDAWL